MTRGFVVEEDRFRKILSRHVTLPLGVGLLSAVFFVVLIGYLLSVLKEVTNSDETLRTANSALKMVVDLESGMRGFLITGDEGFLDHFEKSRPLLLADLQALSSRNLAEAAQYERLERIGGLLEQWEVFADEAIVLRRDGGDVTGLVASRAGKRIVDAVRAEFDELMDTERAMREQRNRNANRLTTLVIGLYLAFSLGFSLLLAFLGRRELQRLSNTYNQAMARQTEHAEELQEQAWLRTGQTELAEQVIGELELSEIGRKSLDYLAGYLGFSVGALYLREVGGSLRRIAGYGLTRAADALNQQLQVDEGLVGQAAREQRSIELQGLPAGYLKVSSGLGEGAAQSVLLVPTRSERRVNGVLELGFLRPLQERDRALLELLAGNLGMALESALFRQRLQEVLAETQQLNEELQVQQEELRSSNEALEEQSRILKESQAHLEAQQAELEQTNVQLAEQRDALDEKNTALGEVRVLLEQRAEELQRASRYKSEFLANMSHELRTPLNSSLILAKLLSENPQQNLSAEQVRFAESIYAAGNDLLNLINDILDISKVEAGKLELRPENTRVDRLVESLQGVFEPLAQDKSLQFSIDIAMDAPRKLYTDRQRIEQILKNLLANAIKFTERGEVSLGVAADPQGVRFEVRDTGIGIHPSQQEVIFDAFCQADGTTNRKFGGTGLGLSISRDLAHLLGGTISVSSVPGEGSCFTLVIPTQYVERDQPAPRSAAATQPATLPLPAMLPSEPVGDAWSIPRFADDRENKPFSGKTVLVIEDEPRFAQILYDLAHELEYNCLVAHGADDGLALANSHLPAAILLDMQLPDHSGLTVLQQLKENPRCRHIPVHVISVEDRMEAALHMGAIGYALKPTSRDQLKDVFARREANLSQKVKRVLLVEDDARQRESIVHLIDDEDVEISAVATAGEALAQLRETIFDCMIIDLKLPDMQGNELLERMASEDICSFPPVIVYTGRNLTRDEEAELMKYSRSIIIKGARSPERLLDEVTLFLHKVESKLSGERQDMLRSARNRDKVLEDRCILLVDDDVRNIFALTSALEQKGARVEVARNGREALERLEQIEDIDLVLMDVMMPEMDGYEATRRIRLDPRWERLPIIAVTAKAMKDDQERCRQAGANDYLAKPIDLTRLFSLIRVWMPKLERI